jgi:hypothetical protein
MSVGAGAGDSVGTDMGVAVGSGSVCAMEEVMGRLENPAITRQTTRNRKWMVQRDRRDCLLIFLSLLLFLFASVSA